MDKPPSVRLATERDEDALYDLLIDTHRTSAFHGMIPYRAEKVLAAIQMGTQQKGGRGIIGIIYGNNGVIVASVGLLLTEWWWSDVPYIMIKWIYVRPEARNGTGHYRELFDFVEWVRERLTADADVPYPILVEFSA